MTAANKPKRVCTYEIPTGSIAAVRRCRTAPLSEEEKKLAEREHDNGQTFLDGARGRAGVEAVRPK